MAGTRIFTRIIDAADRDEYYGRALNVYPALDNWSTSRATLIGDAVHPTFPYLAQGAGMAVEDVAILTRALGGARLSLTRFSFINETGFSGPGGLFGKPMTTAVCLISRRSKRSGPPSRYGIWTKNARTGSMRITR